MIFFFPSTALDDSIMAEGVLWRDGGVLGLERPYRLPRAETCEAVSMRRDRFLASSTEGLIG